MNAMLIVCVIACILHHLVGQYIRKVKPYWNYGCHEAGAHKLVFIYQPVMHSSHVSFVMGASILSRLESYVMCQTYSGWYTNNGITNKLLVHIMDSDAKCFFECLVGWLSWPPILCMICMLLCDVECATHAHLCLVTRDLLMCLAWTCNQVCACVGLMLDSKLCVNVGPWEIIVAIKVIIDMMGHDLL